MAITSSFGDLGVVLNAPTNRRHGLITCIGYYMHLHVSRLGLLHVILINAYVVNHFTCISMLAWGLGRPAETTKSGGVYASYIHIHVVVD